MHEAIGQESTANSLRKLIHYSRREYQRRISETLQNEAVGLNETLHNEQGQKWKRFLFVFALIERMPL